VPALSVQKKKVFLIEEFDPTKISNVIAVNTKDGKTKDKLVTAVVV
jgi:hypothetical protein